MYSLIFSTCNWLQTDFKQTHDHICWLFMNMNFYGFVGTNPTIYRLRFKWPKMKFSKYIDRNSSYLLRFRNGLYTFNTIAVYHHTIYGTI